LRASFVGLGDGWLADTDAEPTADDIAEHFPEVSGPWMGEE
jgi:hypothetical protein